MESNKWVKHWQIVRPQKVSVTMGFLAANSMYFSKFKQQRNLIRDSSGNM